MNKYMACVKETGEVLEHHDLKELMTAAWSLLRLASRDEQEIHIEFSRWNKKDQQWEYMGIGNASPGWCVISGQFTRSSENYLNKSACIYDRLSAII